ncbi:MAG TPA: sulfatase [Planctomycetota bacterium]|nr:sulfatase [Planctomycetota bacterium]
MRTSWLLPLALAGLAVSCSPHHRPPVVVWIVVDTLRADALGCYGNRRTGENGVPPSPHVDALAAEGVTFSQAHSVAPWTIPSLVSQMSGLWPWEHGQNRLLQPCPPGRLELVERLREKGWRTAGVMTNFIATRAYGFDHGFERWDDSLATGHEGSTGHEALAKLLGFADELAKDRSEGLFLFAWLFEPHYRYEQHEGYRFGPGYGDEAATAYAGTLTGDEELPALQKRRAELGAQDAAFLRGRYQSEVAWVDHAIGELVAGLAQRGLLDDAIVVFTSDHGEEILDRGWIGHTVTLHEELVRVPWIVRLPRGDADARRGSRVDVPVSLIDLPATIYALATGEEPDRGKGVLGHSRSLAATLRTGAAPERRWIYLHTDFEPALATANEDNRAHQWGVLDARTGLKWIVDHKVGEGERPRSFLYDLARDAGERENVAGTPDSARDAAPLERLRALVPEPLAGRRGAPAALPEEPWIAPSADADGAGPALRAEPK